MIRAYLALLLKTVPRSCKTMELSSQILGLGKYIIFEVLALTTTLGPQTQVSSGLTALLVSSFEKTHSGSQV